MAEVDYKPGQEPLPEQDDRKLFCKFHYKGVLLVLIPLVFGPIWLGREVVAYRMLYLAICVYLYYILNVMSQGATAFLFIIFLPPFGITASKEVCIAHYPNLVFSTYGSIFMGIMMDVSTLSERLAIIVIRCCGTNLRMLQLMLMIVTSLCSFFITDTFMAAFWMKVAQAVIVEYDKAGALVALSDEEPYEHQAQPYPSRPVVGIYLSVAYGGTLGAMISPFQDPNSIIYNTFKTFTLVKPGYVFIMFIAPFFLGLIVTAIWINIVFLGLFGGSVKEQIRTAAAAKDVTKQAMVDKKAAMGPWNVHSILVLTMIIITMIVLFTRSPLMWMGWDDAIKKTNCDTSVAIICMCFLFFSVPANYYFCRYYCCRRPEKEATAPSLVGWKAVNINTPWAHVFMMSAGFGFLIGYKDSKLLQLVSDGIVRLKLEKMGCSIVGSLLGTLITNFAPATGVATITLDAMMEAGNTLGTGAGAVALPYAAALHNQFLLPVSTTSNTIVAGWGNVRPYQFLLGGSVPTIFMFLFIAGFTEMLAGALFKGYLDISEI